MKQKTELRHVIGILVALAVIVINITSYRETPYFIPLLIVAISIAWIQYWVDFFRANKRAREREEKFPEFVRNLVSSVKSGIPINKAVSHVSEDDYGALSPYIKKLAYQIEWGIPVHRALLSFSHATENSIIQRAVATVIEAEQSGGNIEDVLDSITDSLVRIKEIKEKRKAAIQTQVVQNYIIFIVFLGVMIVIQNMLIPYITSLSGASIAGAESVPLIQAQQIERVSVDFSSVPRFVNSIEDWLTSLYGMFLMLSIIQGFFAGLVIGKLAEGNVKYGLKHSLSLVTLSFFVISLAQGFL